MLIHKVTPFFSEIKKLFKNSDMTDGIFQMLLDFAILGEKGKAGNYGMCAKGTKRHNVPKENSKTLKTREEEYDKSKIEFLYEMIKGAIKYRIRFRPRVGAATLCCLLYNILSVARRFSDYETIGGLFRKISKYTLQLSVAQLIWGLRQEPVTAIATAFGLFERRALLCRDQPF